jgi:signal transduction histidine kinase
MISEIYKQEGINLSFNNFTFSDYSIKGNKGKLQQILLNLISNAKDATIGKEERNITLNLNYVNEKLSIDIIDNGKGIAADIQEKIFDPFFTTKEVNKGTGIGLSLVQTYVTELNGILHVESELNKGATFRIELPATQIISEDVKKPA